MAYKFVNGMKMRARSDCKHAAENADGKDIPERARHLGYMYYVVVAALAAVASVPWAWDLACRQNRPDDHPLWTWTKAHHRVMPVGARPMLTGPQCFAGNRANMHIWHGFQEMVLLRPCDPSILCFRAKLSPGAALVVFLDRTRPIPRPDDPPQLAVRLSSNPQTPSAWLMVDGEGRFSEKQIFSLKSELTERCWIPFSLCFTGDGITLYQEDTPVSNISRPLSGPRHFAFRGSFSGYFCAVDDINIWDREGNHLLSESFDRRDLFIFSWPLCFLIFFLPGVGVLYFICRCAAWQIPIIAGLILVQVTLLSTGMAFWYMSTRQRGSYPLANPLISRDREFARRLIENKSRVVNDRCKQKGVKRRIIFLGSSQTFGEGASEPEYAWVSRAHRQLQVQLSCPDLQVINLGIQGAVSSQLGDLYQQVAPVCVPELLCVSLVLNDNHRQTGDLEQSLERMIRTAESVGARVVLCSEALFPVMYCSERLQTYIEIIRTTAERHGLPYLNLGTAIGNDDDGLRWWDVVHPTDYGHRLIADAVVQFLTTNVFEIPQAP